MTNPATLSHPRRSEPSNNRCENFKSSTEINPVHTYVYIVTFAPGFCFPFMCSDITRGTFLVSLMQALRPTSSILELSHQSYLGKNTNYKASHYVVFFSLLSLIFGSNHSSQHLLLTHYQSMLFLHIFHEDSRFIGCRYVF